MYAEEGTPVNTKVADYQESEGMVDKPLLHRMVDWFEQHVEEQEKIAVSLRERIDRLTVSKVDNPIPSLGPTPPQSPSFCFETRMQSVTEKLERIKEINEINLKRLSNLV